MMMMMRQRSGATPAHPHDPAPSPPHPTHPPLPSHQDAPRGAQDVKAGLAAENVFRIDSGRPVDRLGAQGASGGAASMRRGEGRPRRLLFKLSIRRLPDDVRVGHRVVKSTQKGSKPLSPAELLRPSGGACGVTWRGQNSPVASAWGGWVR
jgi:hypothetical protein